MSNKYDKIFKENIGEYFLSLSKKHLGIEVASSEELKDKLQTTLEREADFLRKITTPKGEKMIIQLEFQTTDEQGMVERMQLCFALLRQKYQLPVHQFVIYVGSKPPKMRTRLQPQEIFTGFKLIDLQQVSYEQWLDSNIPEEMLLAILGDFQQVDALIVLKQIISKLDKLINDPGTLQKYIRQLTTLARLRNLTIETKKTLNSMAFTYDIEKDAFYQKGVKTGKEEGKEEGKKEGREEVKIEMVLGLINSGKLTLSEIAQLAKISLEQVQKIADQNK
ncbi:RpnC/YadD family protein [Microscilla marina]|uniref:Transposase (putative) YhgA-like domain-containing protein n=1 Tax=Microscilla marina ATCC 23134 TaxID=313606 RepID=A1ZDV2_MICM2|nr:hypothetical protein [Microscilla marina]EAY31260.1 hypothetical protein M23134_04093 [Microscilla marina ATCC 23134]